MLEPASLAAHLECIARDGYTVVEGAIPEALLDELGEALARLERELEVQPSANDFEGANTLRVYNLLARGMCWAQVPVHEHVLPIVEGVLDEGCLVSSLSSVNIGPGESAQPIHADDMLIPLAKPHEAIICNSMWALTEFSEANGATRLVPGSHAWDHSPHYGKHYDSVAAEMPRGSVLIWHGSLWHGGGANRTGMRRLGIAMNYCAGFVRQQENQQLGIPREIARDFPPRLQRMLGYGIYNGLIGHIEKRDPAALLSADPRPIVWDH